MDQAESRDRTAAMAEDFSGWSRSVIRAAASDLEAMISGAQRSKESRLRGQLALHVHFTDARLPQTLAIWLYGAEEASAYNVPGYGNAIGVGLKYDADEELDRGAWKLRPISPFTWRVHIDARFQGYRWLRPAAELPEDPSEAGHQIAERVLMTLRRAAAVADGTH